MEIQTGDTDVDGHGTHATGLLLKVAPHAEVFMARVFESRHEKQGVGTTEDIGRRVSHVSLQLTCLNAPFWSLTPRRPSDTPSTSGK